MLLERLDASLNKAFLESQQFSFYQPSVLHSIRSKAWVKYLAESFRDEYDKLRYRVFSADYVGNKTDFKLNELLFDISVVGVRTICSASKNKQLVYVECMEWAIESEFQKNNSRASIIDFSKLVMARSKNKLLVLPQSAKIKQWALGKLNGSVSFNDANYYLAFVPHPDCWDENMSVELYFHDGENWVESC
ncbi:hypothetical protein ACEUAE_11905 [Aeromonas veronii]|uniref:hypothetical protein n=1 Tax=Aeromonas veronii TaxID=654 RepID=UPI00271480A2|nr:hypothetical protein [Aeromonas veronii]WLD22149.1 hypothetical protein O1Q77_09135 [Aeromonas veronii]